MTRLLLSVRGVVQGVGFRPFVWREAARRGISGHVRNAGGRVEIEAQGARHELTNFVAALRAGPAPIEVRQIDTRELDERPEPSFQILASQGELEIEPALPADLAICDDCARELRDPSDRRYRYPFTSCSRCGPRYTIVESLPYDRRATTMRAFELCADCAREYEDPADRRYHAEPLACPACGPALGYFDALGAELAQGERALASAVAGLRDGQIVAVKGLGGFQLLVCARDAHAVARLRRRKRREEKPFAVMFGSLDELGRDARVSEAEARLLRSAQAPIVLCERASGSTLAAEIAPGNPYLGAMLPTTPLHLLLLEALGEPLVCTSGNQTNEPICIDLAEALTRLSHLADHFLSHDRPVVRPMDDSVARVSEGVSTLVRRARGYAPQPVASLADQGVSLGLGAHQKSAIALAQRGQVVQSQHLGDLGSLESDALLARTVKDLLQFFRATPERVVCDLHPDYASTRFAEAFCAQSGARLVRVQHHLAHVASVCAEHALSGPVLGFAWDGIGLGTDGAIWGSEALLVDWPNTRRVAHLAPLPLSGGERAAREPWRSALGALYLLGETAFARGASAWLNDAELPVVWRALAGGVNAPACSSVGRLFDAIAALLGLRSRCSFEGQAAMELELRAAESDDTASYPLPLSAAAREPAARTADTAALIEAVLRDHAAGVAPARIARRFHNSLELHALEVAEATGVGQVALSGGCFQNALLARGVRARLSARGFRVYTAERVPCNDGGIALGQLLAASHGAGT